MKLSSIGNRKSVIAGFKAFATASLIASVGLLAQGCETVNTTNSGTVGVDRSQFVMVSAAEVEQSSAKAYNEIMDKARKEGKLNTDPKMTARVRAIANRLTPQTAVFRADAPAWNWEVNVLQSDDLNAWCMAGGKIAFYSGIITKLQLTDDEIAAIMGHEIAHALREHSRERISQQMVTELGLNLISAGLGLSQGQAELAGLVTNVTLTLPYGRKHEIESDRIGVELAARGGYDPNAAVSLWTKMAQQGGGSPPELLSTHPSPENRIQDLRNYAAKVYPLYQQAKGKR